MRIFLFTVLLCFFAPPAQADEHYIFDKAHTAIQFSVNIFGFSKVTGTFSEYDGDFIFCLRHPDKNAISVTLYSAGIRTSDGGRDEEIQGAHFFDAAQFPRTHFTSTLVRLTDKDNAEVTGNLTLLGVTKPMTLQVHFQEKEFDRHRGDYVVSFAASGVIKRSDFGMNYLIPP